MASSFDSAGRTITSWPCCQFGCGHDTIRVGDEGEVQGRALGLLDVADPAHVGLHVVHAQAGHLHVALVELALELRNVSELGGADRGEVRGMGEQDAPTVTQPLMEVDGAVGGLYGCSYGGGPPEGRKDGGESA